MDLATLWPLFDDEEEADDEHDDGSPTIFGGAPSSITFPSTHLSFRVQIALTPDFSHGRWWEWGWTDITEFVRYDPGITWTSGRRDESSSVAAGSGSIRLENSDGRFSRRNPYGAYYGYLSKNTPIWVQADAGTGFVTLLQHFVNEWPSRWDQSQRDATVPIATAGILRRLAQGAVLKSALRQTYSNEDLVAYWPLEDVGPTSRLVSGIVGGTAVDSPVELTMVDGEGGTAGFVSHLGYAAQFSLPFTFELPDLLGFQVEIVGFSEAGVDDPFLNVKWGPDPANVFTTSIPAAYADGVPHHHTYSVVQNGANVEVSTYRDGVFGATTNLGAGTITAHPVVELLMFTGTATGLRTSHLAIYSYSAITLPTTRAGAADGYDGEEAHARIARICGEESIPFTVTCGDSQAMGPQPIDTALNIFRECEAADLGSLYEVGFGLGYQGNRERDNAAVAMTLDMDLGHVATPPEPTDDDQGLINKFTASRTGGSEATYEKTTGPLGTGLGGPGLYDSSATINVETDNQLLPYASARVVRGTIDEDRWPSIHVQFTKPSTSASLLATWLTMQPFGARINITHPPTQMAPDTIDAFIDGYTQRVTPIEWDVTLNTSPASVHRAFLLAGPSDDTNPNLGYMIPTTCALAEDLTTTEQGVDIVSDPYWNTTGDNWTPAALVTCEGEDMSVSDVGHIYRDNFTRVEVDGWGTPTNGAAYTLVGTAANFDVTGTVGTIAPTAAGSNRFATVDVGSPDQDITGTVSFAALPASGNDDAGFALRFTDSSNFYRATIRISSVGLITLRLTKANGGSAVLVTSTTPSVPAYVAADQWKIRFSARGSALKARLWPAAAAEPASWDIDTTDSDVTTGNQAGCFAIASASTTSVMSYDSVTLLTPQRLTVTRSVNTVVKAHLTGATVAFKAPGLLGL